MDARAAALIVLLLAGGTACGEGTEPSPPAMTTAGSVVPARWRPSPAEGPAPTFVLWVFRTEDCLGCQALDYELRGVQRRHGRTVPLVAVHVGDARGEGMVRRFLADRRIRARVVTVSPSEFQRAWGASGLPAVHLVHDGRLAWSTLVVTDRASLSRRLDSAVYAIRPAPPSGRATVSPTRM